MKGIKLRVALLAVMVLFAVGAFSACGTEKTKDGHAMSPKLTSVELVNLMGNGTNLGNTMEAYGRASAGVGAETSVYETAWGQPITTQEIICGLKDAGFDSLRIPVAWTNAINFESGDYTIGEDYLDRVEEIINYALNEDMYVIINDHWDGGWWGKFGSASEETRKMAMDLYVSMWKQIAERYKDYSDYLIFESANEELGNRLNALDLAPDSGTLSTDECYVMTNKINQAFVDTVRATGGNNKQRFLLIAGYGTDIEATCDARFVMPTDKVKDKLLISVHYYNPFGYCGSASLSSWGSERNYTDQNTLLAMMDKFTQQGYGVVFGEYSVALNEDGTVKDNTCDFLTNFLDNCDYYGYCPMFWDCSSHYIRRDLKFLDQKVGDVFASRSYNAQSSMTAEEVREAAKLSMDTILSEVASREEAAKLGDDESVAWIMYNSSDWNTIYSVGDIYDPTGKTDGIVATDVEVTGEGTYTVALDFTGTAAGYANSVVFAAIGIANGEQLFPGYLINITEVLVNGEKITLTGKPYTTTDDGKCTRLNLFNEWVTSTPDEARAAGGTNYASSVLLDKDTLGNVKTISVTFRYAPGN